MISALRGAVDVVVPEAAFVFGEVVKNHRAPAVLKTILIHPRIRLVLIPTLAPTCAENQKIRKPENPKISKNFKKEFFFSALTPKYRELYFDRSRRRI